MPRSTLRRVIVRPAGAVSVGVGQVHLGLRQIGLGLRHLGLRAASRCPRPPGCSAAPVTRSAPGPRRCTPPRWRSASARLPGRRWSASSPADRRRAGGGSRARACAWLAFACSSCAWACCKCRRHADAGDIEIDLRAGQLRPGQRQAGARLIARGDVVARIDLQQQIAGMDERVVIDIEFGDVAGHFRGEGDGVAVGIGVVGAFQAAGQQPVDDAADDRQHDDDCRG